MATEQRLISLNDLMKFPIRINHYDKKHGNKHFVLGIETVLEYAETLPTIEARPVVHGRLGPIYKEAYYGEWADCLNCGTYNVLPCNYCRICGAQMDGGADNG